MEVRADLYISGGKHTPEMEEAQHQDAKQMAQRASSCALTSRWYQCRALHAHIQGRLNQLNPEFLVQKGRGSAKCWRLAANCRKPELDVWSCSIEQIMWRIQRP